VNLVKRYPTSVKKGIPGAMLHTGGFGSHIHSLGGIIKALNGTKGPFLEALRGVNLRISKGEIFGILGPNGAGKTTLIKILCTLVLHDEGKAYVQGFDVKREPGKVLSVLQAVLPGSRGFNWRLTGRQNLAFYALLCGLKDKEAKKRIDYLLRFTELEDRADDGYQRYSTGMQRKLLLCRALLRDTSILLFDEPTVGLDPRSAAEFRSLLHDRLALEEGKTVLISTHNLHEAQQICDRIAILDGGKITACDTPDRIRYMMFEGKSVEITFYDGFFDMHMSKMLENLQNVHGVKGVTPQISYNGNFDGISMRLAKNTDICNILEVIMKTNLKIRTINTEEPSLEEAFIAITGQSISYPMQQNMQRGPMKWKFR
jgi:ABC-2 type transport system ATP-binding protein